jgi:hypothetical protein
MQIILAYLRFDRVVERLEPGLRPHGRGPRAWWTCDDLAWHSCSHDYLAELPQLLARQPSRAIFILEDGAQTPAELRAALTGVNQGLSVGLLLHTRTVERTPATVAIELAGAACRKIDGLQHETDNSAYYTCCELLAERLGPEAFWQRWSGSRHIAVLHELAMLCSRPGLQPDDQFEGKFSALTQQLPDDACAKLSLDGYRAADGRLRVQQLVDEIDALATSLA